MDDTEFLNLAGRDGSVPPESVGRYLAQVDWALTVECTSLVTDLWNRHPGMPTLAAGHRYTIDPAADGNRLRATLLLIIPDDPDDPTLSDGFGLWQVREPDRTFRWLLLDDLWMSPDTVRPAA
jgi:hypothetical protein